MKKQIVCLLLMSCLFAPVGQTRAMSPTTKWGILKLIAGTALTVGGVAGTAICYNQRQKLATLLKKYKKLETKLTNSKSHKQKVKVAERLQLLRKKIKEIVTNKGLLGLGMAGSIGASALGLIICLWGGIQIVHGKQEARRRRELYGQLELQRQRLEREAVEQAQREENERIANEQYQAQQVELYRVEREQDENVRRSLEEQARREELERSECERQKQREENEKIKKEKLARKIKQMIRKNFEKANQEEEEYQKWVQERKSDIEEQERKLNEKMERERLEAEADAQAIPQHKVQSNVVFQKIFNKHKKKKPGRRQKSFPIPLPPNPRDETKNRPPIVVPPPTMTEDPTKEVNPTNESVYPVDKVYDIVLERLREQGLYKNQRYVEDLFAEKVHLPTPQLGKATPAVTERQINGYVSIVSNIILNNQRQLPQPSNHNSEPDPDEYNEYDEYYDEDSWNPNPL